MLYTLNGRRIHYNEETHFLVQKGLTGRLYETVKVFTGDFPAALARYTKIQLKIGEQKRLLMPSSNYPDIAKEKKCSRSSPARKK